MFLLHSMARPSQSLQGRMLRVVQSLRPGTVITPAIFDGLGSPVAGSELFRFFFDGGLGSFSSAFTFCDSAGSGSSAVADPVVNTVVAGGRGAGNAVRCNGSPPSPTILPLTIKTSPHHRGVPFRTEIHRANALGGDPSSSRTSHASITFSVAGRVSEILSPQTKCHLQRVGDNRAPYV